MPAPRRSRLTLATLALFASAAALQGWLTELRPAPPELRADHEVRVTSSADAGPGSLREALFAAARAEGRVRVVVEVPEVRVVTPLPPLVNQRGVVLVAAAPTGSVLDASDLAAGPVLDLEAPGSVLSGLTLREAPEQGVLVRRSGVRLSDLTLTGCGTGVHVVGGARGVVVEGSTFSGNAVGVRLESPAVDARLEGNDFREHGSAAVWAVAAAPAPGQGRGITIRDNRFVGDYFSLVLGNVPATVENNEMLSAREAAIYLLGAGGVVKTNRIREGERFGVYADEPQGVLVANNEIDGNRGVGILVRAGSNTVVHGNRAHVNGYGIAVVFGTGASPTVVSDNLLLRQLFDGIVVIGGSPVIRANRARGNRAAALRLFDYLPLQGERVVADPFVEGNAFETNGVDLPVRGVYREVAVEEPT